MPQAKCRSCQAPIWWTVTERGKMMPVDALPVRDGAYSLRGIDPPDAIYVKPEERAKHGELYVSHFSTCPDAQTFRK